MHRIPALWRANAIAFISSFCVMVIELIASRILAPHIGVSLYTWTSIIGVILAGIALGNYLGGKVADRYPSPLVLAAIFLVGSLATIAILPATKLVAASDWFGTLPLMANFVLKTSFIFFIPAIILSMVSPMVIKLTLGDLGQTGGVVGTIYACSTAGAILGTFMTGFYFILWFGTRTVIWVVAVVLILTGIIAWLSWKVPGRWTLSWKNILLWTFILELVLVSVLSFQLKETWRITREDWIEIYTTESNYFTIQVVQGGENVKLLFLDGVAHSYNNPDDPTVLAYEYTNIFRELVAYYAQDKKALRALHLGGGGYTFPRYMETIYPESVNEVVEIDPAVTQVAHRELGLPSETDIKTYNQDARLFLIQRKTGAKYNIVIGDVFNTRSTPYHLTALEFNELIKANLEEDGIYMVNVVDNYRQGRYMPSFIHTLRQTFKYVYLFSSSPWEDVEMGEFVIAATDQRIDIDDFMAFAAEIAVDWVTSNPHDEIKLEEYLSDREPILLTDDHVPTDIMIAPFLK